MNKYVWVEYHASAYDWQALHAYTSKESLVKHYNEDYGTNYTYKEIMDEERQNEAEEKIEKIFILE